MRKIKVKFEDGKVDESVLFAIQRLDEILFFYTKDSYKAKIFNSKMLLEEYIEINNKIDKGLLEKKNDEKILEEMLWSLDMDTEAVELIGKDIFATFKKNVGSMNKKDKNRGITYLLKKLSGNIYFEKIKDNLYKAIESGSKKEIDRLLIAFVCEAKHIGYEARYIFKMLNMSLITRNDVSKSVFREFLNIFDCENKEYMQLVEIDNELANLCVKIADVFNNISIKVVDDADLPSDIKKKVPDNIFVSVDGVRALDEYSALQETNEILKIIGHFYAFYRHKEQKNLVRGYIKTEEKYHYIRPDIKGVNKSANILNKNNSVKGTMSIFDSVLVNPYNFYLLTRIMDIHNVAIGMESDSNALLDLWSILELVLEKENEDSGKSRISQISEMIIPFIRNVYIDSLIKTLEDDFLNWNKLEYKLIIKQIDEGESNKEKLFAFISLEKYDELRKGIYAKLDDYPLMRYRMFCLNENFKSTKNINRLLKTHEDKVRWQIYRIYRARNCIIHDGEDINKIEELVENLHYYIDIMCEGIIKIIGRDNNDFTIQDAIYEMHLRECIFKECLTKEFDINNCIAYMTH